ncbi:alpha-amylase [Coleophoma cylindrospora]|uniref:Alpha-amylase n=1 Tax=Coleophoma cylindrospora TaxID=1849047 RepID=A0A3D8RSE4_9HELO|nr:alpha-amylase [Coleophoma cylindrospora]
MPDAEAWKQRSIYQVLTDRFAVAGHGNGGPSCDYKNGKYCGGTWQGIISKLDYIQGMGFDAVWISPITKNIEDVTHYGVGYHGYWQEDIYSVNPHFGTADDLLALSDALHARGMYLMIDVVVNHMGSPHKVDFSRYTPFDNSSYYHSEAFVSNYDDQTSCEQGWLGDGHVPLPDLDTENPTVVHTFHAWISAIVQRFRIDGLRIDTVKHVRKSFWPGFIRAAGVWSMGEVLSGAPDYLSSYQPYVGGLLDYGTYYPLKRAFNAHGGSMYELTTLLSHDYRAKFADMQQLATFMENHDMPRFTHDTNSDVTIVKSALCWTVLTDGIPIIYYGQEQSYSGDGDPGSRELMWTSEYKITPLYQFIALLNKIRKLSWNAGFGSNLTIALHTDVNIVVTQKGPLLMVLSNKGSHSKSRMIPVRTAFPNGTVLVNVLNGQSIIVKNTINITVVAGQPQLYLPLTLASHICSNILPPPQGSLSKFFSIFHFLTATKNPSGTSLTTWSSGARVNTKDILRPESPLAPGRILQPPANARSSPYSIFYTSSAKPQVTSAVTTPQIPWNSHPHPHPHSRPHLNTQPFISDVDTNEKIARLHTVTSTDGRTNIS